MLCLLIGFIQPIPIKKGITLIIATDAIELNLTAIQLLMVIIADAIELIALMLMLPIKRITHKLMLKCLAEIIEPMRGWLIGYGFLKMFKVIWNFANGFSLKIVWVAIGKSFILIENFHVEPYDLSLEIISFDDAHQWASSSLSQSKRSLHSCCSSRGSSISSCSNALQRSLNPWGVN